MASPILWQNEEKMVTLIDVPKSIAFAQGSAYATSYKLLSSSPLQHPFPSNEPKSQLARSRLNADTTDEEFHTQYRELLEQAIEEVRNQHSGDWCLPRPFIGQPKQPTKKRRLDDVAADVGRMDNLPDQFLSSLAHLSRREGQHLKVYLQPHGTNEPKNDVQIDTSEYSDGIALSNNSFELIKMHVVHLESEESFVFNIPPDASFYLGDCTKSRDFRKAVRKQAETHDTRHIFDFILLDPPWPNRSVRRTHKTAGSTYAISASVDDIRHLILDTRLEILMADKCLVAIWITNRPSIRELVLGEDGIFDCWKVELAEEWVWLKTTTSGEPIVPLDGAWRKPYEVLLIGRRKATGNMTSISPQNVQRKILISVPDLHSRKPCLKALIEPLMKDATEYRALEVFARHLVAGWWSWGDECIKFNWDGYWQEKRS